MKKNRDAIIILVLLGVLLAVNFMQHSSIKELSSRVNRLSSDIRETHQRLNQIEYTVNEKNRREKLVYDHDYNVINVDDAYQEGIISYEVTFNEINRNSKVYLAYKEVVPRFDEEYEVTTDILPKDGDWVKVEMQNVNDIVYTGEFRSPYTSAYDVKVIVDTDGVIQSQDLMDVDLFNKLYSRFNIDIRPQKISSEQMEYSVMFSEYIMDEKIITESAICRVTLEDTIIEEFDITKEEEEDRYNEPEFRIWDVNRKVSFDLGDKELDFEQLKIEVVVTDSLGITYKQKWGKADY